MILDDGIIYVIYWFSWVAWVGTLFVGLVFTLWARTEAKRKLALETGEGTRDYIYARRRINTASYSLYILLTFCVLAALPTLIPLTLTPEAALRALVGRSANILATFLIILLVFKQERLMNEESKLDEGKKQVGGHHLDE